MMNAHGEQMSGMRLSKRLREVMEDMGIKRLTVKAKVRTGDHWTKEKHDAADLEMRKSLFGSQY